MVNIKNKYIILLAFLFLFVGFITTNDLTGSLIGEVTSNNGYRNAYWTCYDGISSNAGGPTSCKSSSEWRQYANSFCIGHCNNKKIKKCGVSYFNVKNGCTTFSMPNQTCFNDCSQIGTKQCTSATSYKICGNYDRDSCLELSGNQYCPSGQTCNNGQCIKGSCTTCSSLGYSCGTWSNGCGSTINCGACSYGYTCSSGKCIPSSQKCTTCSSLGYSCGTWSNGCGSTINCGICSSGNTCQNGRCTTTKCIENWQCGAWSTCYKGQQVRSCTDINNCGTTTNKPKTSQSCTTPGPGPLPLGGATSTTQCTPGYKCYSTKYKGYQNADCSWNGLNYCSKGCSNGQCNIF